MPRPEKVQAVAEIKERIEGAQGVFLTEFRGLSVKQLSQLRRSLRDSGADYKVVKMSLARRAIDELGIEGITEHLSGPTALTFADTDIVSTAKALKDAGALNESLVIKAGLLTGNVVVLPDQISTLAEIEPREVLLAKIAGAAKSPLVKAAAMFQSFTRDAASMFSQLLEKKEEAGPPEGAESVPDDRVPPSETDTSGDKEVADVPGDGAADDVPDDVPDEGPRVDADDGAGTDEVESAVTSDVSDPQEDNPETPSDTAKAATADASEEE